jgi:hypothetical protein
MGNSSTPLLGDQRLTLLRELSLTAFSLSLLVRAGKALANQLQEEYVTVNKLVRGRAKASIVQAYK